MRLNDSIAFNVNKTANAMRNRFNVFLKPYGLTSEQYVILKSVDENPNITQTQLAEILEKDKTTLTRMLDTLIKNGFIVKETPEHDRRSYLLKWTAKARNVMEEIMPITTEVNRKLRSMFTTDELDTLFRILQELRSIECLKEL